MRRVGVAFVWAVLLAVKPTPVPAFSGGISTASFNPTLGCNSCHVRPSIPTVTLSGPTEVPPGATNVYTLAIMTTRPAGGFNVSTPTGMLSTGGPDATSSKTIPSIGGRIELTHSVPKNAVSGVVTFSFEWTAPASFTSATLVGWGNAVNANGNAAGDGAASALLTISSAAPSATPTATGTATWTATPPPPPTTTPTITTTPSATASASATPDVERADVNCDGVASAADATAFMQAFGSATPGVCDADVDGDGSLTAHDLAELIAAIFAD